MLTLALISAKYGRWPDFKGPISKMRYSIFLLALLCVACGNYAANAPTLKPYKMDIQQGNVITPKMMMQLRPGMTKSQVRFIMGTPLLTDSFHGDRWDYFYQMRKDGKIIEQRRVILDFEGDSLAHVRGDVIPAGSDPATMGADQPKTTQPRPVVKPAAKETGILDKLKFWGNDEDSKKDTPKAQTKPVDAVNPGLIPEAKPEQKPEPEAVAVPMPEPAPEPAQPTKPAAAKETPPKPVEQENKKGWLDKLKFWGDDEKAQPKPAPTPAVKPVVPAKIEPRPASPVVAEPPPAPRRSSLPEAKPKAPPQPTVDLPPEDAPQFFEKMLEKIGF